MSLDIHLTYEVPLPRDIAFDLFTRHFHRWWPLALSHTGLDDTVAPIEPIPGTALTVGAGSQAQRFGVITRVAEPELIEWSSWFRQRPERATTVRVNFVEVEYGTRLVIEHIGWNELNANHRERFNDWPLILWHFISYARRQEARLSRHV